MQTLFVAFALCAAAGETALVAGHGVLVRFDAAAFAVAVPRVMCVSEVPRY